MKTVDKYIECLDSIRSKLMMGRTSTVIEQAKVDSEIDVLSIVINDLREVGNISRDTFWNEVS